MVSVLLLFFLLKVSKQSKGQELIDRMCVSYREIKLKVKNLEEENALILDQANAELSKDKVIFDFIHFRTALSSSCNQVLLPFINPPTKYSSVVNHQFLTLTFGTPVVSLKIFFVCPWGTPILIPIESHHMYFLRAFKQNHLSLKLIFI
jgi:hypothetical protein